MKPPRPRIEKKSKEKHNFTSRKKWQRALNAAPNKSMIKTRSLGGARKATYMPIEVQQALADYFFDEFDIIDSQFQLITNEILCTVKISVLPSYPNADHRIISGSGAKPVQCDSRAQIHQFPKGKKTNSLEYCAPAARSVAISNALITFANIFGRNLGRTVSAGFNFTDNKRKKIKRNEQKKVKN